MENVVLIVEVTQKPKLIFITQHLGDYHNLDIMEKCIISKPLFTTKDNNTMFVSSEDSKESYSTQLNEIYRRMISEGTNGQTLFTNENISFYSFSFSMKDKDKKRIFSFLIMHHSYQYLTQIHTFLHQNLTQFVQDIKWKSKHKIELKQDKKGDNSIAELVGYPEFKESLHIFHSLLLKMILHKIYNVPIHKHLNFKGQNRFGNLKNLFHLTNKNDDFSKIMYHVMIGNQLIVRSNTQAIANDVIDLFTNLIPSVLIKSKLDSNVYVASFDCNFLSIGANVKLDPTEVDFATCCLVDIDGSFDAIDKFLVHCEHGNHAQTAILGKMDQILKMENIKEENLIHTIKLEILHQSKLIKACRDPKDVEKILKIFKLNQEDVLILKYFGSCLPRNRSLTLK